VGFAGLALFLVSYFVALRQGIRLVSHSASGEASWILQYLAFMILYYTTEGQLMRQDSIYWALYVAVVVGVACAQVPSAAPFFEEESCVAEPAAAVPAFAQAHWGNPND
jgi:O-antigen ligase